MTSHPQHRRGVRCGLLIAASVPAAAGLICSMPQTIYNSAQAAEIRITDKREIPWPGDLAALAWSPDGKKLAVLTGLAGAPSMIDIETGRVLWEIRKGMGDDKSIAFTPDGKYVVTPTLDARQAAEGAALDVRDAESGQIVRQVKGIYGDQTDLAKTPNIFNYDAQGRLVSTIPKQGAQVNVGRKFFFSADGKELIVGSYPGPGRPLTVYSTGTWQEIRRVSTDKVSFANFVASPDLRHVAVSGGFGKINIVDTVESKLERVIVSSEHFNGVTAPAFAPDGKRLVSGATGGMPNGNPDPDLVRVWDLETGAKITSCTGNFWWIYAVAWSPDGKNIAWASSTNHEVYVWNVEATEAPVRIAQFARQSYTVAFSPDGRRLAFGGPDKIVVVSIVP